MSWCPILLCYSCFCLTVLFLLYYLVSRLWVLYLSVLIISLCHCCCKVVMFIFLPPVGISCIILGVVFFVYSNVILYCSLWFLCFTWVGFTTRIVINRIVLLTDILPLFHVFYIQQSLWFWDITSLFTMTCIMWYLTLKGLEEKRQRGDNYKQSVYK